MPNRFVVESGVDGSKTLFCEFEPYAMLIASDSTTQTSGDHPSAITNGASWSSGVAQAYNVNYVVFVYTKAAQRHGSAAKPDNNIVDIRSLRHTA